MANIKLNYAKYDIQEIITQLQSFLQQTDTWKDIYRSSTGQTLIELFAGVLNVGMFYVERRAQESYIDTARLRSSLINLVSLLNYKVRRKTSARGILTFSIDNPINKIIYIPKYTVCSSGDGTKFLTSEAGAIKKGDTSIDLRCIQGELVEMTITANGALGQEYTISDTAIENSADKLNPTFKVVIDNIEWKQVNSFFESKPDDKHFILTYTLNDYVNVKFGDNIKGLAPAAGSQIQISYIRSAGLAGNVALEDIVKTVESPIYNESNEPVSINVTNETSILGGADEESTEAIRYNAPRVFKTGERAVTREDFTTLIHAFAGVAAVNVWGENEEAAYKGVGVDFTMLNKVKMAILLQNWQLPTERFKEELTKYLYDYSMLTVKYEFVEPVILQIIPDIVIKVKSGYSFSQTHAEVRNAIAQFFELGVASQLGGIIKYSNIVNAVDDLPGVAYHNLTLKIKKQLDKDNTLFTTTLDAFPILPESVQLYINNELITTDINQRDGTGEFTADDVTGTIDYATGDVSITIDPIEEDDIVSVRYQQNADGNINLKFFEIAKFEDLNVLSITSAK